MRDRGRHPGRIARHLHFAVLTLLLAGCGGAASGRVAFSGRVSKDGEPVPRGFVSFRPSEGHSGPAANTDIVDGEYRFSDLDGPMAGPHQVVVNVAAQGSKAAGGRAQVEATQWDFDVNVHESGEFESDFELESQ